MVFSEVLKKNKELNGILNSEDIKEIIKENSDLKSINWIFKNKIK